MEKKENIKIEQISIDKVLIKDLLKPDFVKKIDNLGLDLYPINLTIMPKKEIIPIVLSHENPKEIDDKILHLSCRNEEMLNKIKEILKEFIKNGY